ncbi:hypothetical protein STCU_11472 [Strigomonas culicis]|uniref:Uncharacterized protein n=1 Tax=Strigomonas culicis TaxID=28005 RepID=S9TH27_9TRYP|nr:hypothetical protein STCU_11472 [Strigomonas culicis]|eukprot:EPY16214.1 hypothetical protein STCU_11472 [Strigomonas culicis]
MCTATPQRLDTSSNDGNILFSFEAELELMELQRHSAGLFAAKPPLVAPPRTSVEPLARATRRRPRTSERGGRRRPKQAKARARSPRRPLSRSRTRLS